MLRGWMIAWGGTRFGRDSPTAVQLRLFRREHQLQTLSLRRVRLTLNEFREPFYVLSGDKVLHGAVPSVWFSDRQRIGPKVLAKSHDGPWREHNGRLGIYVVDVEGQSSVYGERISRLYWNPGERRVGAVLLYPWELLSVRLLSRYQPSHRKIAYSPRSFERLTCVIPVDLAARLSSSCSEPTIDGARRRPCANGILSEPPDGLRVLWRAP